MLENIQELLQKVDSGEVVTNMLWVYSNEEQEALRRCSLVRTVDENLYTNVLAATQAADERIPYSKIVTSSLFRPLPGKGKRSQFNANMRNILLEQWWQDDSPSWQTIPEELKALSLALAETFAQRGMPVEQLYHLLLGDRELAAALCAELRRQAEENYDLSLYLELVRVFDARTNELQEPGVSLLSPAQERLRQELRRDYESRVLLRKAWYATENYLQRENLARIFQDLVTSQEQWVLQIYATGGMGKTTFLRNLAARECLPEHVPIAFIDFDYVEQLGQAADQPALLLISIARQLNVQ
ncbi:MAG: hypothetical protein KC496_14250, partial [Anaerolineae bacterium]|nr:hypothetical protein [Anaerolineae bacterium]